MSTVRYIYKCVQRLNKQHKLGQQQTLKPSTTWSLSSTKREIDLLPKLKSIQKSSIFSSLGWCTYGFKIIRHGDNLNKENKTFKCERHVSATPVPSSVYGWNYNDEQYIVEN